MSAVFPIAEVTCDVCGIIFKERRRRWFCDHCHKYYYVCSPCVAKHLKCPHCGIRLKKQGEPISIRKR